MKKLNFGWQFLDGLLKGGIAAQRRRQERRLAELKILMPFLWLMLVVLTGWSGYRFLYEDFRILLNLPDTILRLCGAPSDTSPNYGICAHYFR